MHELTHIPFTLQAQAKKTILDFYSRHPELKPKTKTLFFGLIKIKQKIKFRDAIKAGIITPQEADDVGTAQLILYLAGN